MELRGLLEFWTGTLIFTKELIYERLLVRLTVQCIDYGSLSFIDLIGKIATVYYQSINISQRAQ